MSDVSWWISTRPKLPAAVQQEIPGFAESLMRHARRAVQPTPAEIHLAKTLCATRWISLMRGWTDVATSVEIDMRALERGAATKPKGSL